MTVGFAPTLASGAPPGTRVVRSEYPAGVAGVKLSLETIAQRIREGALSPAVQGEAFDALKKAGFNGRGPGAGNTSQRVAALLSFVRESTLYAPDPPGVEYVKSAEAMLCLRPGLCVRGGDCDDQVVLLGSLCMGVGIPVNVIKQTFGYGDQEHVLLEAQGDDGRWIPLDPSSDFPAGRKAPASSEFRLDPSSPSTIGLTGVPEAEFIGVGAPIRLRFVGDTPDVAPSEQTSPFASWSPLEWGLAIAATGIVVGAAVGYAQKYRQKRRRR